MYWILLLVPVGLLLWGMVPRPAGETSGSGADEASLEGPVRTASAARVGTFNIHGGKSRDGDRGTARAARDLEGLDIAALQEVHDTWRSPRQLKSMAAALGMAALAAPTRWRWFRWHRANALLTRYPVGLWRRMRLAGHRAQRFHFRNLTVAQVHLHQPVWVLCTHLNRGQGNDEQLEQVMREFIKYYPAVLMGDFNMDRAHPVLSKYLARDDIVDALGQGLDGDDPQRIDWILCRGLSITDAGVTDSRASDHPLYWCQIEL